MLAATFKNLWVYDADTGKRFASSLPHTYDAQMCVHIRIPAAQHRAAFQESTGRLPTMQEPDQTVAAPNAA